MHYCVGTDSVHTTATACDYLGDRATDADTVTVVSVVPPDEAIDRQDCQEALNVATVRLFDVGTVETEIRAGEPAAELLAATAATDADELVIGACSGRPGTTHDIGSTADTVLTQATVPVVVVPLEDL